MKTSQIVPTVTSRFPISVPLHQTYSEKCVFKVMFGKKKFYIAKGKFFLQACEQMATIIERGFRNGTFPSDWYYHVIKYCMKARVKKATAELLHDGSEGSELELLKIEQEWLNKTKNHPDSLNNNFDVYIPKWIPAKDVKLFNKWKDDTKKSNSTKNRTPDARKKH